MTIGRIQVALKGSSTWDPSPTGSRHQPNVERMHPYQRRRASLTRLRLELQKIIETERLVGVVMARLVQLVGLE